MGLTWYGLLTRDGRFVGAHADKALVAGMANFGPVPAAALIKVVFKSAKHMRAFFAAR